MSARALIALAFCAAPVLSLADPWSWRNTQRWPMGPARGVATATATVTPLPTASHAPEEEAESVPTPIALPSPLPTATASPTSTATATPVPPSPTATLTPTYEPSLPSRNWSGVASKFEALKSWREAKYSYQLALKKDPKNAQAYFGLGRSLSKLGDQPGAIEAFKAGLDIDPSDENALLWLGNLQP